MSMLIFVKRAGHTCDKGRKTEKEQFAGAEATYTIEALMHDARHFRAEQAISLETVCAWLLTYSIRGVTMSFTIHIRRHGECQPELLALL